jgi:hypothetical protein
MPERVCVRDVRERVSARLPARLVLRQHAQLQCQNRDLRPAPGHTRPHRRALRLERGMRLGSVHTRARDLGPDVLDRRRLHAGLHDCGMSHRIDLRDVRIRGCILCRLVCGQR